jgi:hypothetical protein
MRIRTRLSGSSGDQDSLSDEGDSFVVFEAAVRVDSASRASDLATSAATCGCMARIGDGLVIGNSDFTASARAGTENRSCTGVIEFARTGAVSLETAVVAFLCAAGAED